MWTKRLAQKFATINAEKNKTGFLKLGTFSFRKFYGLRIIKHKIWEEPDLLCYIYTGSLNATPTTAAVTYRKSAFSEISREGSGAQNNDKVNAPYSVTSAVFLSLFLFLYFSLFLPLPFTFVTLYKFYLL